MKITAKVKNDAMPGATTIKITNLSASDGNDDFTTEDVSLSVTIVKNEPDDDNNNNDNNNNDNNNDDNNNNDNNNDDNNNDDNNNGDDNNNDNNNNNNNNDDNNNDDNNNENTPADGKLPYAGIEDYIIPTILILCVVGITSYIRYKKI